MGSPAIGSAQEHRGTSQNRYISFVKAEIGGATFLNSENHIQDYST